tara:strand:+ start:136 stop:831 length:696 start_codon:yes stop_codon:yes gene_type:complete
LITLYNAIAGSCAEQEANAGGGGVTPAITIATGATGNFNNAVKLAIFNINTADYSGTSTGIFDGSTSTFGTASSPTRTTQNQNISATDLRDNAYFNGTGSLQSTDALVCFGCFIRHNGSIASNFSVRVNAVSNGLVSSSMTNSQILMQQNVLTFANQQDTTTFNTGFGVQSGMYEAFGFTSNSHFLPNIQLVGKGGGVPQAGDNFTIRIDAFAVVDGVACTATHDITITLT